MAKTMKRVVAHPKFYMMVDEKLTHVPKGITVEVTEAQIAKHGAKLIDPSEQKKLVDGEMVSGAPDVAEIEAEIAAKIEEGVAAKIGEAVADMQKQIDGLATENAELKKAAKKPAAKK